MATTIINEKEKALSTTLTNTEFITAVGTDAETEGSGAAAIVETFKDDFGSAIDTYISGITGQIDALQTACTKQTNKGLYGEEITNTVNTLLNNLYTSLTEYAEAVQTAEKDIIAEVEKMFLNADETISGAMDADSALLATGEIPNLGNEHVGTNPEIMPNTPMTSGDEVPVASRGGGRRVTQMLYAPYKPPQLYPSTGTEGEYDWKYFAPFNTTPEETQKTYVEKAVAASIQRDIAASQQKAEIERWKILQDTQTKVFKIQQDATVDHAKTQDKMFGKWDEHIRG